MNRAELLELIAISTIMYRQANKYGYIPHFNEGEHCCWCVYSAKRTEPPKRPHNKAHRCTACPMLRVNTPNHVEDCTDMYTHRIINPNMKGTWDLRLTFWTIVQRRILQKDADSPLFRELKNIQVFLWDIDEMLRKERRIYLTKTKN